MADGLNQILIEVSINIGHLELRDAKVLFAVFSRLHAWPWVNFRFAVLLCNQNIISFLHLTFSLGSLVLIVMLDHL